VLAELGKELLHDDGANANHLRALEQQRISQCAAAGQLFEDCAGMIAQTAKDAAAYQATMLKEQVKKSKEAHTSLARNIKQGGFAKREREREREIESWQEEMLLFASTRRPLVLASSLFLIAFCRVVGPKEKYMDGVLREAEARHGASLAAKLQQLNDVDAAARLAQREAQASLASLFGSTRHAFAAQDRVAAPAAKSPFDATLRRVRTNALELRQQQRKRRKERELRAAYAAPVAAAPSPRPSATAAASGAGSRPSSAKPRRGAAAGGGGAASGRDKAAPGGAMRRNSSGTPRGATPRRSASGSASGGGAGPTRQNP
jgi:hypothetical protein